MTKAAKTATAVKVVDPLDKEVDALRAVCTALDGIQPDSRYRVLTFLKSKFSNEWPTDSGY